MTYPASERLPSPATGGDSFKSPAIYPDIFFVPAPACVVTEMLKIAQITSADLVMDLGSGDGQILIAATREYGARGVGIEIDPKLVNEARAHAAAAGLADRLTFIEQDFFATDLRPATALMLYLLDSINIRLRPKILAECAPGTRVITYSFEMGEWQCDAHTPIAANGVSLWIVPANLTGIWHPAESGATGTPLTSLTLTQRFQELAGQRLHRRTHLPDQRWPGAGSDFTLDVEHPAGTVSLTGRMCGDEMEAALLGPEGTATWQAVREHGTQVPLEISGA